MKEWGDNVIDKFYWTPLVATGSTNNPMSGVPAGGAMPAPDMAVPDWVDQLGLFPIAVFLNVIFRITKGMSCLQPQHRGDQRHMHYCQGQADVHQVREKMLHGVEAACDALNKDSGGMLEKLTAGIAARTSAIIERARQSGDAARVQLAEEAGAWATTHYWGSRLQLWCPAMDALEGVRDHGQESARHMAYRGVIAGAVDEALKEAARAARALARKEAAGSGGLAEPPPSPDHPRTRVHTALADAAVCTAKAVRDTLRAWAHRAAASAGVVAVDTGAGGAAGAGAAGEGDARAKQVQERQAKAAAAEGERKAGGDPTKDLKRCSGRMCDARSAACQGWAVGYQTQMEKLAYAHQVATAAAAPVLEFYSEAVAPQAAQIPAPAPNPEGRVYFG